MNSKLKSAIILRNFTIFVLCGDVLFFIFPFPQIVWRLLLVALSVWVICLRSGKLTSLEKWMIILCLFNFIYYLLAFLHTTRPETTHLGNTLCAMLPVSLFAYLSQKKVLTPKFMSITVILLIASSIAYYFYSEHFIIDTLLLGDDADITNNASTAFIMLLPLLFLVQKPWLWYVELCICVFFIASSVKRGNIVASAIPLCIMVYYRYRYEGTSRARLLILAFVVLGAYLLSSYLLSNNYFLLRLQQTIEGDLSNRNVIYKSAFHIWFDSDNIIQLIFGHGWRAVTDTLGVPAHSDWLEILADNGVLGVVIYLIVFINFGRTIRHSTNSLSKCMLLSAFFIWGAKSVYSMAYVSNLMTILMVSVGYALGCEDGSKRVSR